MNLVKAFIIGSLFAIAGCVTTDPYQTAFSSCDYEAGVCYRYCEDFADTESEYRACHADCDYEANQCFASAYDTQYSSTYAYNRYDNWPWTGQYSRWGPQNGFFFNFNYFSSTDYYYNRRHGRQIHRNNRRYDREQRRREQRRDRRRDNAYDRPQTRPGQGQRPPRGNRPPRNNNNVTPPTGQPPRARPPRSQPPKSRPPQSSPPKATPSAPAPRAAPPRRRPSKPNPPARGERNPEEEHR